MSAQNNKSAWNHTPDLPLKPSPVFDWPQSITTIVRYFFGSGFVLSQRTGYALVAIVVGIYCLPSLSDIRTATSGDTYSYWWVMQIWLVLLVLNAAFGSLYHGLYYVSNWNQSNCKFDKRPLATQSQRFWFASQLWDNVFFSLVSGVLVAAFYLSGLMWALAYGYGNLISLEGASVATWVWFVAAFPIIIWWSSFHFYAVHRWMHEWPWLYEKVHALHHKNINIGSWSGMAMHPGEHVIYLSSVLIHFVIPTHPILILYHLVYLSAGAYLGHSGFEGFYRGGKQIMTGGTFFHQLHHRYFDCNYGTIEVPFDQWFGSFHSGTEEDTQRIRRQQRGK